MGEMATERLGLKDVGYRLYRMRRLIVLAAVLPLPALALAIWAGVAIGVWAIPVWIAFAVFHAVRFPNSWVDLMAFGVTFSILLVLAIPLGFVGMGPVVGYPLALLAGLFIWMKAINSIYALERFTWPQGMLKLRRSIALPAETVRAAFFLRPNATVGYNVCGPANENGVFRVTATGHQAIDPLTDYRPSEPTEEEYAELERDLGKDYVDEMRASFADGPPEADVSGNVQYFALVLDQDQTRQELITMLDLDDVAEQGDEPRTQTIVHTVTPTKRGCVYKKLETGNIMGLVSGAGFFLCDIDADYVTATLAKVQGKPDRSIRAASRDSLLFMLARMFVRRGLTPE